MVKTDNEILNKYYELGELLQGLACQQPIIQIDVDTTLETADKLKTEDQKLRFLGMHYLELVESLRKAGIIN